MKWLVLVLALAIGQSVVAAEPCRVLSYNIRFMNSSDGEDIWANRASSVVEVIRGADLCGLQEVVAQQFAEIRAATPEMEWYGVGRDDGQQKGEMTPIGWKSKEFDLLDKGTFWLSESPERVGEKSWDAALPRIASWVRLSRKRDRTRLLLVNTHFDHVGQQARLKSAELIRNWIAEQRGDTAAILIGDLNAELQSPPLMALLQPPPGKAKPSLSDALATTQSPAVGPDSTWNGFREIVVGRRIDHALVSEGIRVLQFATLDPRTESGRFASDHLPIQVTINF